MDSRSRRMLLALAVLFVAAVALQIHGSSIAVWKGVLLDESSPSGLLYSTPKTVRSDEWLAWTPSVLSQAFHTPPFPVENANVGAGKTPLLVNLPVRHYAMFFRPQLYGFFVFDIETAYAFYWNVKVFGLFLSFFFLFRALTREQFWLPFFGAGWVWLSAYIQWWFPCAPMLPEMLASWAAAIVCVLLLFRTAKLGVRIAAAAGLVVTGVNFTLCFYPPFQIPLVYLGMAVLIGCFWQERRAGLQWRAGVVAVGIAAIVWAAVITPYILECKPTLELVAGTEYPGARRSHGGDLSAKDAFNGVLGFFNASEEDYLTTRGNASEASNFYPLWLLALAGSGVALWRERRQRRLEAVVVIFLAVLTLYTFCPFPEWFCRWTLLNYVTGTRALLTIGIAGIILTMMILAKPIESLTKRSRGFAALAALGAVVLMLVVSLPGNEKYLTFERSGLLLALNGLFFGLYFFAPQKIFCGVFLSCLALNNGSVNPVATGLGPLLDAGPSAVVREIKARDPDAKWMAYSSTKTAQFLKTQGINVINGLSYVPDLEFCRELDPDGKFAPVYNRYALSAFLIATGSRQFRLSSPFVYAIDLAPTDPVLLARGVRYAVFPDGVSDPAEKGMEVVAKLPGMWIYRLVSDR